MPKPGVSKLQPKGSADEGGSKVEVFAICSLKLLTAGPKYVKKDVSSSS